MNTYNKNFCEFAKKLLNTSTIFLILIPMQINNYFFLNKQIK